MGFYFRKFVNPHSIFALSWALCLLLYSLRWALILPDLEDSLIILMISFILVFGLTGFIMGKVKFTPKIIKPEDSSINLLLIINSLLWLINFGYSGLPFIKGVRDDDFGVPFVIVLATAFNSFLSVYCMYLYLVSNKKKYLLYIVYCLAIFLLEYSRGYVVMSVTSMFFLWINLKNPRFNFRVIALVLSGALLIAYLFGVIGNLRIDAGIAEYDTTGTFDNSYSSKSIMVLGEASDDFQSNNIPGEFFWGYLYMTSPIGNLQHNLFSEPPGFLENIGPMLIHEVLFDSFSKRVDALMGTYRKAPELIVAALTVCTALAGPYIYAGWGGMIVYLIIIWLFAIIYTFVMSKQPLGVIGVSILSTIFFFLIFDNMFTITALGLQLFFPLLGSFKLKIK
ncbi:oligosaccharide repeat unit polymerase [Mucilaginibacter limnophilus]|uniref:Oligosaccharide repeat unit polymerase n=1 Tax=Mucilaginibacter limnophilus TaxID=1932778 RepID=A0A437MTK9_9SPHI|nr:oligosaccharide repeat unit polymerase [Mucilaginibacter limnophilus]RVU00930.1 oligosaccharide repeat unit polymerase [Mucilaginibacter limnophilus]